MSAFCKNFLFFSLSVMCSNGNKNYAHEYTLGLHRHEKGDVESGSEFYGVKFFPSST